jgi:hypothetical protein
MFPVIGYVTRFEQQEGNRFSASVDVKVPADVSHVQLDTEVFGSAAHAVPHRISKNAELANISPRKITTTTKSSLTTPRLQ